MGAASSGESRTTLLVFKEGLRRLETIAVDPRSSSEIVLAHIVLAEKYDTVPQIVPVVGTVEEGLARADAALCSGNIAREMETAPHTLDLVEEWNDIADLPFVHGLWITRRDQISPAEAQSIIESGVHGMAMDGFSQRDIEYLKRFQYDIDEEAIAGLTEFLRMAYYHGILQDIPDLTFQPLGKEEDASLDETPN